jgi:two-component system, OmpR family, catabolic regulation response regulator CreB
VPTPHLLLLEDDPSIAKTVGYSFERVGLRVTHCSLLAEALPQLRVTRFDLLILDVGLPDGSGLDVCRAVRLQADWATLASVPIVFLSAQADEVDRIVGLELGADDYVSKPFSPRELVARVRGMLRRVVVPVLESGLSLDVLGQRASWQGEVLPLTRLEWRLLQVLHERAGRICSRAALLDVVWGQSAESTDRTVDTHIKTLRGKLAAAGAPELIETHRGMGYSLELKATTCT